MPVKYDKTLLADYLSRDAVEPGAYMSYGLTDLRNLHQPGGNRPSQLSLLDLLDERPFQECLTLLGSLSDSQLEETFPPPYLAHFLNPTNAALLSINVNAARQPTISPHDGQKRNGLTCDDPFSTRLILELGHHFQLSKAILHQQQSQLHLKPNLDPSLLPCILSLRYRMIYCKLDRERYFSLLSQIGHVKPYGLALHRADGVYRLPTSGQTEHRYFANEFQVPAVDWA